MITFVSVAQYKKETVIRVGLHFFYNDFSTLQKIKSGSLHQVIKEKTWSKPLVMQNGFGLSGTYSSTPKTSWQCTINGSIQDYPSSSFQFSGENNFLLDLGLQYQYFMFKSSSPVNPFLSSGVAVNIFKRKAGFLWSSGAGMKFLLFKSAHIYSNFIYQPSLQPNATSHFYYNFGIATNVYQKTKKHPVQIPLPTSLPLTALNTAADSLQKISGHFNRDSLMATAEKDLVIDNPYCPYKEGNAKHPGCLTMKPPVKNVVQIFATSYFFNSNKYLLSKENRIGLQSLVNYLHNNKQLKILLIGHTDNVGTANSNQILSLKRAGSLSEYFIQNGIAKNRITILGLGETAPVASNFNENGRLQNRRVSIILQ